MVNELFLAGLGRLPEKQELDDAVASLGEAKDRKAHLADLMWVMLNTKEFLFNH
jgi:hypothetical protein